MWSRLIADAVAGKAHTGGYNYVFVHRNVPQLLSLWHNGKVISDVSGQHGRPGRADRSSAPSRCSSTSRSAR